MYTADFHIHSRYSRATSRNMNVEEVAKWAVLKGINLLGTGDFSHYLWLHELRNKLVPTERTGVYQFGGTDFLLTTEICNIFDWKGRSKRIHNIVFISSLEKAEKLNRILERYGDLNIDGRPILHLEAKELVQAVQSVDEHGFVVPAHVWTPHFSLFGSNSGFDHIEECFENTAEEIFALETGLSSDPEMNWRLSALDRFSLISNSDAHSPAKLGRELNVFQDPFDLPALKEILRTKDSDRFLFTVEYFPEEGKYHFDGHRLCRVCLAPEESIRRKNVCPQCGKSVTVGVMHRVQELADNPAGRKPDKFINFKKLVPLDQIIGFVLDKPPETVAVQNKYLEIVRKFGSELQVLLQVPEDQLYGQMEDTIADGIRKVRKGEVKVQPGYDGEFGKVEILRGTEETGNEPSLF